MSSRRAQPPAIDPAFACFRLHAGRSGIQGTGIFAREPIPARRKVIEYSGERITMREAVRRLRGRHYQYLFRLSGRWCLDARISGSGAEYVNHSCDPNLFSWRVKGHILLMSRRRISAGEELTFDYNYAADRRLAPCNCNSPRCRGTINLKPGKSQSRR